MRKLGFLLLFLGFGWISLIQLNLFMRASLRPVVIGQYQKLSKDLNYRYTRDQVQGHILDTALAVHTHHGFVLAPGILMLAGGLLCAFAPRKRIESAA